MLGYVESQVNESCRNRSQLLINEGATRRSATSPNEIGGTDACDVARLTSLLRRPRSCVREAVLIQEVILGEQCDDQTREMTVGHDGSLVAAFAAWSLVAF
jgi:hypothetical protein